MGFVPFNKIDKSSMVLNLISKQQEAVSSNLANINTPGYQKQNVSFEKMLTSLEHPLETKLTKKLGQSQVFTNDGGKVVASEEMLKMQKNFLFYTMATRRVSNIATELRTVINVGK